jgi:predicted GIY-YIG superfamily endonuclease
MIKYAIYEISCNDETIKQVYIGHTDNFEERMRAHKANSNCKNATKIQHVHVFIKEHGGWNNWDMKIIETIECEDREDARMREQHWMNQKNTLGLNVNRAYVSEKKKHIEKKYKSISNDMKKRMKLLIQLEKHLENPNEYYKLNYEKIKKTVDDIRAKIESQERLIKMVDDNINNFI